jgi:hypothetical protein
MMSSSFALCVEFAELPDRNRENIDVRWFFVEASESEESLLFRATVVA